MKDASKSVNMTYGFPDAMKMPIIDNKQGHRTFVTKLNFLFEKLVILGTPPITGRFITGRFMTGLDCLNRILKQQPVVVTLSTN